MPLVTHARSAGRRRPVTWSATAVPDRRLARRRAPGGVAAERVEFDGGSDFEPFIEAGIPAGGVLSGDADTKTGEQAERWGGKVGEDFDPCYHAACDRAEGIDRTALDRFGDALAGTVARFAESPQGSTR
jgi:aminopeptidase S